MLKLNWSRHLTAIRRIYRFAIRQLEIVRRSLLEGPELTVASLRKLLYKDLKMLEADEAQQCSIVAEMHEAHHCTS